MKGLHKNWNVHIHVIIKVTVPPENRWFKSVCITNPWDRQKPFGDGRWRTVSWLLRTLWHVRFSHELHVHNMMSNMSTCIVLLPLLLH